MNGCRMCLFLSPCTAESLVAHGHVFSLTVCGLTRIYSRPVSVPVLFLLVLGFGRFASPARVCVCVCVYVCVCVCWHQLLFRNRISPPFATAPGCLTGFFRGVSASIVQWDSPETVCHGAPCPGSCLPDPT